MGDRAITGLMVILVLLNVIAAAAGLALCALAIWVAVDPYKLYPIADVSGKDDIFAAAWIAIFTGFAYFCTAIFGICAALSKKRSLMLTYLLVMFIIFLFECASCITAVTNRDYLLGNSNLVKRQMLKYYAADSDQGKQITGTWNKVMQDAQCCGTDSPLDWMEYNSTFRQTYGNTYTWPLNCCQRQSTFDPADPVGCNLGQISATYSKGCFSYIETVLNRYTWAISWYGFARANVCGAPPNVGACTQVTCGACETKCSLSGLPMFQFFVILIAMVYFLLLE